ncbi:MAG TPA: ornithine cyclodeaminase [Pseudonocardiaceae bacterium]|nr:ornithine cyclodeaminase [Pseudonocardiaceae bacterium]
MTRPDFYVFTRSDLADLEISPTEVISAVREGYLALADRGSRCPTKLMMPLPEGERDAVSYAMLGYDANTQCVGFKTSYRQGADNREKYYTVISLYDDATGLPFVLMDCDRVGASRTPATTALIAEACAKPGARSALMIGTGVQGHNTLPYLLTVLPKLDRLMLYGTHPDGIKSTIEVFQRHFTDRHIELVSNVPAAVSESDIVVVASGRAAHPQVKTSWMKPGGLMISVSSKGVHSSALLEADYAIATSEGQLGVTGSRFAATGGSLQIDAEFPDVLAGRALGRRIPTDRVFAFSSGMVITDIPVAHALATRAIAAGRGQRVQLWS